MRAFVNVVFLLLISFTTNAQQLTGEIIDTNKGMLILHPVLHGTLAMEWNNKIILIDPYGGSETLSDFPAPDLILITDIHGDHLNHESLKILNTENTKFIVPQAVADKIDEAYKQNMEVLPNGKESKWEGINVKAIPMYNLPDDSNSRHKKGRGNGYVLTIGGKNIYVSGDTEDIPEMRSLKKINIAFVCMNQPYTMTVEQAASAVLEFKPEIVFPYHFRGSGGLSDVEEFKRLVNDGNKNIEVRLESWYPEK